jgi:glycosyltransferase involved in cell wall biosynthesis
VSESTVLCVCTYKRPAGIQNLLEHLCQLENPGNLSVVVIDNDAAGAGKQVCDSLPASYPYRVQSRIEERPGIVFARNAALNLALSLDSEFIAFLDDDEWPSPQWLSELHRVQQQTDADVVGGPTQTVFPENTRDVVKQNPYYGADLNLPEGAECKLEAAGNFLLRAATAKLFAPEFFHQDFANSCGEDLAFFTQLEHSGAHMCWAPGALVSESVEAYRLTDEWMKSRVVTIANSRVRVMQLLKPGLLASLTRGIKTGGLFVYSMLVTARGLLDKRIAYEAWLLRWKFWGKFTAHLNIATQRKESP